MADEDKTIAIRLQGLNDHYNKAQAESAKITEKSAGASEESLKKLSTSADRELGKTVKKSQDVGESISKIGAGVALAGAGILAAGMAFSQEFEDLGREVMKVQRYTGMTAESASVLRYQAQATGVDADKLTKSLGFLAKGMANTPDKFAELGISVRDSRGQLRSTNDVLLDVVDKFNATTNATERLNIAQTAFGKSGGDLMGFLAKGREGLADLAAEAEKYGLVLNDQNLAAVKESVKAHKEYDAAVQGLKVSIGQQFLPILTTATEFMADAAAGAQGAAGEWMVYAGAALVAAGSMAGTANEAVTLAKSIGGTDTALKRYMATQAAAAGGGLALAATLGLIALPVIGLAAAAKDATDKADKAGKSAAAGAVEGFHQAKSYDELIGKINRTGDAYNQVLSDGNPLVRNRAGFLVEATNAGIAYANQANELAAAVGITSDEAVKWLSAQAALGAEFPTTADAVERYRGVVVTTTMTEEEASQAIKDHIDQMKRLNDAVTAATDPLFAMQKATRDNEEAQQNFTDAQTSALYAQVKLDEIRKAYGTNNQAYRDAERELADAHDAVADAQYAAADSAAGMTVAANNLNDAIAQNPQLVGQAEAQLKRWVDQGLLTQEQADNIAGAFTNATTQAGILNSQNVDPTIDQSSIDEYLRKLYEARQAQDRMIDFMNTNLNGSPGGGYARNELTGKRNDMGAPVGTTSLDGQLVVGLDGRWHAVDGSFADGGYGRAGGLYRVNERGTEMFSQGGKDYLMMGAGGGKITPANQFMVAGGGGSVTNQDNSITIQTTDVDRGVRAAYRERRKAAIFAGGR